jgi:hypothetical protein
MCEWIREAMREGAETRRMDGPASTMPPSNANAAARVLFWTCRAFTRTRGHSVHSLRAEHVVDPASPGAGQRPHDSEDAAADIQGG